MLSFNVTNLLSEPEKAVVSAFTITVYKIYFYYLRHFCLCLSPCKITGISEWIFIKFDAGKLRKSLIEHIVGYN
jgi:hypothetical protein